MFKKISKIILSLILILGLMFTVTGCNDKGDSDNDNTNQDVEFWK